MIPFFTNGEFWGVARVAPGDPRLVDRTGTERLATTDPLSRTIYVSNAVEPPLLDHVMLHEVSHAIAASNGLLRRLRGFLPVSYWVAVEEWAAQMVENYSLEAIDTTSNTLGRPVCIRGLCYDKH